MTNRLRKGPLVGIALMLLVAFLLQGTWALAGTTGGLSGSVTDDKGAPVSGAAITAASPSASSTTQTDASGHFVFLSLSPDTYTISMTKAGYQSISQAGVSVFADQTQTLSIATRPQLKEIGSVTARTSGDLVKSGTTSDIYSVNAATAEKVSAIGGGTNLNNAYSALASQPGVTVGYGGIGWGQTVFIHGASYSQVGYEFDGVPVNRAFDNYNANTLTNLGQQELQVVTGGSGTSSSSETVGGFINQVIRTGTYPGFGNIIAGVGGPNYYHQLKGEVGGATPNRLFSYYLGLLGYDQTQRYGDQFNGGSGLPNTIPLTSTTSTFTANFPGAFPYCNKDGSDPNAGFTQNPANPGALDQGCLGGPFPFVYGAGTGVLQDREAIANVHIGIPHKHDQGRDDIQLLYSGSFLRSIGLDSINDAGGLGFLNANLFNVGAQPGTFSGMPYADGVIAAPSVGFGQAVPVGSGPLPTTTYLFPSSPTNRVPYSNIDNNLRDAVGNAAQIVKLQYQKNIGSNAYLRAYGYTFYSDWLQNGPVYGAFAANAPNLLVAPDSRDYELITHTRGGSLQFADQINSKNLLQATVNYTTASVSRYNNLTFGTQPTTAATSLTDAAGNCYNYRTGALTSCFSARASGTFIDPTRTSTCAPPYGTSTDPAAPACVGPGPGQSFVTTFLGPNGTLNKITPIFTSYSLTDEFRPNEKLLINAGVRLESFKYNLPSSDGADYKFWFHAAQNSYCYDPANGNAPVVGANRAFTTAPLFVGLTCPVSQISGQPTLHPDGLNGDILYTNHSPASVTKTKFEPRFAGTYTLTPDSVVRFSVGRYANPANTATYQYLNASAKGAATFDFQNFFGLGFNTPSHSNIEPTVSTNADLSFEHRVKGTDISFKLSPYYRYVTGQTQDFFIGPGFVSAIPTGNERAYGVEFQINKGDPNRNGLSGQLSYTYNHARMTFTDLQNGVNPVDPINGQIDSYNALTGAGNRFGVKGAPCYNGGVADTADCNVSGSNITVSPAGLAAGVVINPYYTANAQPILDRKAAYPLYQSFPNPLSNPGFPDGQMTILWPQVLAGYLNYKHNKLSITPNFQMIEGFSGGAGGGGQYGSPLTSTGIDPRVCAGNQGQAGVTTVNPGLPNYITCGNSGLNLGILNIPDPYTGKFDSVGQFQNPWLLNINAQIKYELSNKVTANLVLANVYNRCFGHANLPWAQASPPGQAICGYDTNLQFVGTQPGAGYFNGVSPSDPANGPTPLFNKKQINYPYSPLAGLLPFSASVTVQFKI
ncbi:MAG: TonB-dependent receptor [Candidatus Eremiobacteraeota bacterium]|nr:TonB-dependent receptor [Candidatus Eremiobacteraeota bacterium]